VFLAALAAAAVEEEEEEAAGLARVGAAGAITCGAIGGGIGNTCQTNHNKSTIYHMSSMYLFISYFYLILNDAEK
jgi:hypothetical protein